MKTISIVTHALGLERNWLDFSDGGIFHATDSIVGVEMTGRSILRVTGRDQGGENFRIKLFGPVFDRTGVFARRMLAFALNNRN